MTTLRETFVSDLKSIYDAEFQILEAFETMIRTAEHAELKRALRRHLPQTRQHIERLKKLFDLFESSPERHLCKGMQGLIKESMEILHSGSDAELILAAQKVEHYEIAVYGSLAAWARHLGHEPAADVLEETLAEEKSADATLTAIAESSVNADENQEASNDHND